MLVKLVLVPKAVEVADKDEVADVGPIRSQPPITFNSSADLEAYSQTNLIDCGLKAAPLKKYEGDERNSVGRLDIVFYFIKETYECILNVEDTFGCQ
jgi:hypothetical protein